MPVEPCTCEVCITRRGEYGGTVVELPPVTEYAEIPVPVPAEAATAVFQNLGLSSALASARTPEAWESARQALEEALQPVPLRIGIGGYGLDDQPPTLQGGSKLSSLKVADAAEFVRLATNGQMEVQVTDGKYVVRPSLNLDNAGFQLYLGGNLPITDTGDDSLNVSDLRDRMKMYANFRRYDRRRFLAQALKTYHSTVTKKDTEPWTADKIKDFERFLSVVKSNLKPERNPFQKFEILPHKTLSSRNWGIEIEAVHIDGVQTPANWELKGDVSLHGLSTASYPSRSSAHTDACASVVTFGRACNCSYNREDYGPGTQTGEWNSPVLKSYHSRGLKYLTDQIEDRRTNQTPGVHVHVEASDLTPQQATVLAVIYTTLEPLFDMEYGRFGRKFCQPVDTAELINRFNKMREAKAQGKKATEMNFTSRYWTVNAAALASHGTIEFRAMGARYNYEHLIRWAYFCREMINIVKANVPQRAWTSVRTIEDLVVLFSKYGKETPTPSWAGDSTITDVIEALGQENRRLPHAEPLVAGEAFPLRVFDDYTSVDALVGASNNRW